MDNQESEKTEKEKAIDAIIQKLERAQEELTGLEFLTLLSYIKEKHIKKPG